ncbi:unnamed protein product [Symbiodinium microadriaticum]|nr:unnamed protein product [Symbiodinium microadriaticum]
MAMASALRLALLFQLHVVEGKLLSVAVLPHGDFAYDPGLVNRSGGSVQLHTAARELGHDISEETPDLLFVTTPHGLELSERYLVYLNSHNAGASPLDDMPHAAGNRTVPMNFTSPQGLAMQLLEHLQKEKLPAEGLRGFSDAQPLPISWGEILPLSFVQKAREEQGLDLPPVLLMSFPLRRFNHSDSMVPELLRLGSATADFLEALPQRVAWIVSADLAHTHLATGPYGYCPCAQPFDDAVVRWAKDLPAESAAEALLHEGRGWQRAGAASCGFTGLVAAHGAMAQISNLTGQPTWRGQVLAYAHPTYYGMMVARFERTVLLVLSIALMNLVTAVMVNSSLDQASEDKEVKKAWLAAKKKKQMEELKVMFHELDEDGSGDLSLSEIRSAPEHLRAELQELAGSEDIEQLFMMLDYDGGGAVDADEFCEGVFKAASSDRTSMELGRITKQPAAETDGHSTTELHVATLVDRACAFV